jgi:curli biogenesis system outer membrane secretion channel CsgG
LGRRYLIREERTTPSSAALLLLLKLLRACLRAAATAATAATAAPATVAVDIALRRPLGPVSAGVCALDLFGRLVAQKEKSLVKETQIPGKP